MTIIWWHIYVFILMWNIYNCRPIPIDQSLLIKQNGAFTRFAFILPLAKIKENSSLIFFKVMNLLSNNLFLITLHFEQSIYAKQLITKYKFR